MSGLIGEDIDAVCRRAEDETGVRIIPVNAPGFVGPKNLGNRIAGEVLLERVIGTGEPPVMTHTDVNLIGEYNIAGDLWQVEPLLAKAGVRILSRMTGNSTFEEITWAHRAKLNVVVCGRALVNVAREMEHKYGIPYVEVSFFGSTEIAKALRAIRSGLNRLNGSSGLNGLSDIEALIKGEEKNLKSALKPHKHLRGKKAVLYTGGVKSWSFISALRDLGIEIVAVGTKKSTVEDEDKMREILGPGAPLVEDVTPKNLLRLLKERGADMLIAGGRNQYLAVKEGYPFVDVNQERHTAYAGYEGLVNFAEQISNSLHFYSAKREVRSADLPLSPERRGRKESAIVNPKSAILIDPLKHSPSIGAAMALQGIDGALPIIHGAQGCTFLGKVLLTKHFREPIALASSKLFAEDVVLGSEDRLIKTIEGFIEKNHPALIGVLTSGLTEIKGDDIGAVVRSEASGVRGKKANTMIIHVSTPDYDGGLEAGYAKAVEGVIRSAECGVMSAESPLALPSPQGERIKVRGQINILAGPHLTPADVGEVKEIIEDFGMNAILLPDLSALDGSRKGISPLAAGGTTLEDLGRMGGSAYTIALGMSMEPAAQLLKRKHGIEYQVFESAAGISSSDALMRTLSRISGMPVPRKYERQRAILVDAMRDAHAFFGGEKAYIALEPDLAVQISVVIDEMGGVVEQAVIPSLSPAADRIRARDVRIGDLFSINGACDLLVANSHGESTAKRIGAPLYEIGFPVCKSFGYTSKTTVGYRGTLAMIHEIANLLMKNVEKP